MKTFKINTETNDLEFDGQNNILMVADSDEEAQSIERVLTTNIEEWFLNPQHGFNYSLIQTKRVDYEAVRLGLIQAITQEPRVEEVEEVNMELLRQKRKLLVNFRARMKSGNIVESEVII